MLKMDLPMPGGKGLSNSKHRAKLIAAALILLPILSLLAGAALAAHQYGVL